MTIPHVRIREIRHRRELCTLGQAVRIWGWGEGAKGYSRAGGTEALEFQGQGGSTQ